MPFAVPFVRPHFPVSTAVSSDFADIVESNWFTNFGPKERQFSRAIADYIGAETQATTFSNATLALIAAIQVVLGRGDASRQILVPSFTFAAGAEAIVWAGYTPLLIDIDRHTLQPSLADAAEALAKPGGSIAGILLCNTFGIGNPEIARWEEFAATHGLPLIIDSAAGFGSSYPDGRAVGTAGTLEVFSFHATKPFAIGEGGAVVTRDHSLDDRLRAFQNFGFAPTGGAVQLGLNAKLQEINAAIGIRQLEVIEDAIESRRETLRIYRDALDPEIFEFPVAIEQSSLCFATLLLPSLEIRDQLLSTLRSAGVEARTYYSPALHRQEYFSRMPRAGKLSSTDDVGERILSVPLHPYMSEDDIGLVLDNLTHGRSAA